MGRSGIPILVLAGFLSGCAFSKKVRYEYSFGGKSYRATMQRGRIIDTSFVHASDSSVEKVFVWKYKGSGVGQTQLSPKDTSSQVSPENPRTQAGVEKVIYGSKRKWKDIYNQFLRSRPGFRGKMSIRLIVKPDGNIEDIFILVDTTGYPEFAQAVIDECGTWVFEKSGGTARDWITFPVTFYE